MRVYVGAVCLGCLCCITSAQITWTESVWQTLGSWLAPEDPDSRVSPKGATETVDVLWGLPDREATVGEVFEMTVPNNAFSGNVQNYKVTQVDSTTLPRWLYFNATANTLYGVPSMVDLGSTLLEVTAYGAADKAFHSKASFTPSAITSFVINVHSSSLKHPAWNVPLAERESQNLDKIYKDKQRDMCNWNENIIRASLVLDAAVENMDPESRVNLLKKAAAFLQKNIHAFRLTETRSRVISQLMDTSVLMAGPGNAAVRTTNPGVELSWIISCGEANNVDDISQVLSHNVQNGRISTELGYGIIGWHLTETQPPKHIRKVRQKRQIQLHTPLNTPTLYPVASPVHISSSTSSTASATTVPAVSESEVIHTVSFAVHPTATSTSLPYTSTTSIPPVIPSTLMPSIESFLVTSSLISESTSAQSVSVSASIESSSIPSPSLPASSSSIGLSSSFSIETSPTGLFIPETAYASISSSTSMLSSLEPSLISTVFSSQTHSTPNEFVTMTAAHSSEQLENALTAAPPVGTSSSVEVSGISSVVSMTPSLPSQVLFTSSSEVSKSELTSITNSEILTSTNHESMFSAAATVEQSSVVTSMPAFTASASTSEMFTVTPLPTAVVTTTSSASITEPVTAITELYTNFTAVTAIPGNASSVLNETTLASVSSAVTHINVTIEYNNSTLNILETSPSQSTSFYNLTTPPGFSPPTPFPYDNQTGVSSNVTAGQPGAVTLSNEITSTHFYNGSTLAEISLSTEVPNVTTAATSSSLYNYTVPEQTENLSSTTVNFGNSTVIETAVPTAAPSTTVVALLTTPGASNQSEVLANATSNLVFTAAASTAGIPTTGPGIHTTAAPVTGNSTTAGHTAVTAAATTSIPTTAVATTGIPTTATTATVVSTSSAHTSAPTTVTSSSAAPTVAAYSTSVPQTSVPDTLTSVGVTHTTAPPSSLVHTTEPSVSTSVVPTPEVPSTTSVVPTTQAPTTSSVMLTTEVPSAVPTLESPATTSASPTPEATGTTSAVPTAEAPSTASALPTSEAPGTTSVVHSSVTSTTTSVPTSEAHITTSAIMTTAGHVTSAALTSVVPSSEAATTTSVIPTTEAPVTSAVTTESPIVPTSHAPATTSVIPTTEVPVTSAVTTESPIVPTSHAPATTSVIPTTKIPVSSVVPTTESPTSVVPTTEAPTTSVIPSTEIPITSAVSTTESPTSVVTTTEVPAITSVFHTASTHTTAVSSSAVTSNSILLLADSTSNSAIYAPTSSMSSVPGMMSTHHLSNRDVTTENPNQAPQLVNPMRQIVTSLGTYFDILVPYDTFYDFEDGNTRSLVLSLLTSTGTPVSPDSFIQLNSETQTLYGLPLEKDITGGTLVFMLVAEDDYGQKAVDNIEIIINTENVEEVSFIIQMVFDTNYEAFSVKRENLMVLMHKLASFYGDQSAEYYTVTSVRNGSVLVEWTDQRVSKLTCQSDSISDIYGQLFSGGKINPAFREKMLPDFPVTGVSYELLGVCTEITTTAVVSTEFIAVAAAGSNAALAIILPIILFIILVIIIFLVYWFCIRNRHKHSDYLTDHEKQLYANNRKPVLLESDLEMNDVPLKPRKPLILDEDVPSKAFDNPGYLDLDDGGRPPPPPYVLPMDDPISPGYGPMQATSTPKLYMPYKGDTPDNRPLPPPYRLPPLYLGTPGSSDI